MQTASPQTEPIWGEPPPTARGVSKRKWLPFLTPFRARAGTWGRIPVEFPQPRQAYALTTRINTGDIAGIERGEFKAETRRIEDAGGSAVGYGVWVCYQAG